MRSLTILQNITPCQTRRTTPWPPLTNQPLHLTSREETQPKSWRVQSKGFTPKSKETIPKKRRGDDDDDDKIPEVVFERMISRILFSVGVPLLTGFGLLQILGVVKEQGLWDVPRWLPFLAVFVTFGTSALGIAYGSLSTSLNQETEGSFLGFEQFQKNWDEVWKEEEEEEQDM